MTSSILRCLAPAILFLAAIVSGQSDDSGYIGYSLHERGDSGSVVYETNSTSTSNVTTTTSPPDVYLNASVSVGEIDITVQNLTAKVTLDAEVLSLLSFSAGVAVSVDRVELLIENVTAKVLLEARLENVVTMIGDVLDSLDLNPIIATLGQDIGSVVTTAVGTLTSTTGTTSTVSRRSYELANNILYSVNDYSGNAHTNRILAQNGSLVDQSLDNNGVVHSNQVVGYYTDLMTFNGYNESIVLRGRADRELEYVYSPFPGLSVISAIYTNGLGEVVATQVLSEGYAGGTSTVGGEL